MNYLIAVLDWGMGHASRCIPLARRLKNEGHKVYFASSGTALELLKNECPDFLFFELPSYNIRYAYRSMPLNMALQFVPALKTISAEKKLIEAIVSENKINCIVSDGRFGCYHSDVKNIWMAHQLHIQYKYNFAQKALNVFYHRYIRSHFSEVWVPDFQTKESLAGGLSKPISGLPHQFLGPLSRYDSLSTNQPLKYKWLALLSGPEPQRSFLEKELLEKMALSGGIIVRGIPGGTTIQRVNKNLEIVDWLHGEELAQLVAQSEYVICRSGYSTLMDLHFWQKKALLIPTPGQTEQEYLALRQQKQKKGVVQQQGEIDIEGAGKMLF